MNIYWLYELARHGGNWKMCLLSLSSSQKHATDAIHLISCECDSEMCCLTPGILHDFQTYQFPCCMHFAVL